MMTNSVINSKNLICMMCRIQQQISSIGCHPSLLSLLSSLSPLSFVHSFLFFTSHIQSFTSIFPFFVETLGLVLISQFQLPILEPIPYQVPYKLLKQPSNWSPHIQIWTTDRCQIHHCFHHLSTLIKIPWCFLISDRFNSGLCLLTMNIAQ